MTYIPKKGFLLQKRVKRTPPKSAFLKALEREQAKLMHPEASKVERKLVLLDGYAERRK